MKIIFDDKHTEYHQSLSKIGFESPAHRKEILSKIFAKKSVSNVKLKKHFIENDKSHSMETRNPEMFEVYFANTERLRKSPVIYMQKLLNDLNT